MTDRRHEREPEVADIGREVTDQLFAADPVRADRLEALARLRTGRIAAFERERTRLTDAFGDDHPRALALLDRIERDRELITEVAHEAQRARTEVPDVDEKRWVVHGMVLGDDLSGVPDVAVTLHLDDGQWLEELGRACTDDRGYFQLGASIGKERGDEARAAAYLRVYDRDGKLLHVDARPLSPRPGRVDLRELVLGKPARDCGPAPKGRPSRKE